ncbi:hypothetical protein N8072_00890 [bacterium]|jgi:hypothetical protein|nr:hypothetical protein [bacterium]MDB4128749.1 hypothetical protein [bacterium]MDC1257216.1 hypothetical protein [bacterium]
MKKRAIILGTSHSESSCKTNGVSETITDGRWHDYLKTDHDYEVLNLSRAGCTVQQQMIVLTSYLMDNPNERFDLAIVEGRNLETAVSCPTSKFEMENKDPNFSDTYQSWLDHDTSTIGIAKGNTWQPVTAMDQSERLDKEYVGYYVDYTFSYQHMVDTWTCNLAICMLLERVSKKVFWFSFNAPGEMSNPNNPKNVFGRYLMDKYQADLESSVCLKFNPEQGGPMHPHHYCECNHLNKDGHRELWYKMLYPKFKDFV